MAVYGFRVHVVEAYRAMRQREEEFGRSGSLVESPVDVVMRQVGTLVGQKLVGEPSYTKIGDPAHAAPSAGSRVHYKAGTPVLRIDEVKPVSNRVEFKLSYGTTAEDIFAMSTLDGEADVPLREKATAREYNCVLYFPEGGERAVLLSEVRGRSFAGVMLLRRLVYADKVRAHAEEADVEEWVRWMPRTFFDESRINEVLTEGSAEGLKLERKEVKVSGDRIGRPVSLTQDGIEIEKTGMLRGLVTAWAKRFAANEAAGSKERLKLEPSDIRTMVALVDGDVRGMDFNDGEIYFDENGKRQTLSPNRLDRIQVYPIGPNRPTMKQLKDVARRRLELLAKGESIPISFD